MKKLTAVTGIILLMFIVITSVILPSNTNNKSNTNDINNTEISSNENIINSENNSQILQEQISINQKDVSEKADFQSGFILGEHEGCIAAYKMPDYDIVYISHVRLSNLPIQDNEAIQNGIYAKDEKQLRKLIEDYCS